MHFLFYTIIAAILLIPLGNFVCRKFFDISGLNETDDTGKEKSTEPPAGRVIGALERILIAIGIVTRSWEVLAAVVALKTVARFKDLDNKRFAEYFLIGSLVSFLWAIIITSAWISYDKVYGANIRSMIVDTLEPTNNSSSDRSAPYDSK